jgi:hypothetical protein
MHKYALIRRPETSQTRDFLIPVWSFHDDDHDDVQLHKHFQLRIARSRFNHSQNPFLSSNRSPSNHAKLSMILSKLSVTTILVSASLGEAAKITPLVEDKPELKTLTQTVGIKPKAETPSAHFHKVKKVDADTPAKKSSDPETRIVGGNSADYGEYQYYAQLLYSTGIVCGGSLIAPNVVLSAAHCYDAGLNKVSVGTYDFSYGYYESGYSEHSGITHVAIHPDYVGDITGHTGNMEHDIMLLRLDDEFTQFDPITLNSNAYKPATGDYLTVIGLGLTDPDSSYSVAGTLQEVELQTVAPNQCFPPDHPGIGVYNDDTEFCASDPGMNGGKMSCQGRSLYAPARQNYTKFHRLILLCFSQQVIAVAPSLRSIMQLVSTSKWEWSAGDQLFAQSQAKAQFTVA